MAVAAVRKVIRIDEEKCDGCGQCIPNCAEGALAIIDGKARLVSDRYCDGLGACLGHCPQDAISVEERPAEEFDEAAVEERLRSLGRSLEDHSQKHQDQRTAHAHPAATSLHGGGCPGSRMMDFGDRQPTASEGQQGSSQSELRHWPVKINLVHPQAPYFQNAHLLVAADCAPFAYASLHPDFLRGKAVVIGCPKFDDLGSYHQKLAAIVRGNDIQSITVLHMEVPCCFGLAQAVKQAVADSGKDVPVKVKVVGVSGELTRPMF